MNYLFRNQMELIVGQILPELLKENGACTCERCRMDALALKLNQLPPRYVVTRKGEILTELDATRLQYQADILTAVLKAVRIVRVNPRHGDGASDTKDR